MRACVFSCVHKADDEQQFGDTIESEASGQVMVFWTLVSRLRGARHLFDPLNHFLICRRGNGAEGLVEVLAAHVGEWPLLPPHRGVFHHLGLRRQLVGLVKNLLQLGQRQLWEGRGKRCHTFTSSFNPDSIKWGLTCWNQLQAVEFASPHRHICLNTVL